MSLMEQHTEEEQLTTRDALLKAARELFAEKGAEAVSTREIASKANVNNGLIHRHFRTKDALLREVLEGLSAEISTAEGGDEGAILIRFFHELRERETYWKLIARCMLDGQPVDRVQRSFPTVERAIVLIRQLQADGRGPAGADPRSVAVMVAAVAFGWLVFEPWLLAAGGFADDEKDEAGKEVIRLVRTFLTQAQPPA